MKYISLNWTRCFKIFNWKEKENARRPNTYGARLYIHTANGMKGGVKCESVIDVVTCPCNKGVM